MARLNAYLKFNGNCQEAITFYKKCLGGELFLQTVSESPMAAQMPQEMHDKVLHSLLTNGQLSLMASDMFGQEAYIQGNTVSLCLVCDSKEEIESAFAKLSEGGTVTHALKEEFFGTFGDLTDQYGFNWMFQYGTGQNM